MEKAQLCITAGSEDRFAQFTYIMLSQSSALAAAIYSRDALHPPRLHGRLGYDTTQKEVRQRLSGWGGQFSWGVVRSQCSNTEDSIKPEDGSVSRASEPTVSSSPKAFVDTVGITTQSGGRTGGRAVHFSGGRFAEL